MKSSQGCHCRPHGSAEQAHNGCVAFFLSTRHRTSSQRRMNRTPPENAYQDQQRQPVERIEYSIGAPNSSVVVEPLQQQSRQPERRHERAQETAQRTGACKFPRETETEGTEEAHHHDDVEPMDVENLPQKSGNSGEVLAHAQPAWQRNIRRNDAGVDRARHPDQAHLYGRAHISSPGFCAAGRAGGSTGVRGMNRPKTRPSMRTDISSPISPHFTRDTTPTSGGSQAPAHGSTSIANTAGVSTNMTLENDVQNAARSALPQSSCNCCRSGVVRYLTTVNATASVINRPAAKVRETFTRRSLLTHMSDISD